MRRDASPLPLPALPVLLMGYSTFDASPTASPAAPLETSTTGWVARLPMLAKPDHGNGSAVVDRSAYVLVGRPEPDPSTGAVVERLDPREGAH